MPEAADRKESLFALLQRIIREVNEAHDILQAVDIIVRRVGGAMHVDVCSVYLVDPDSRELVLMATEGLNPEAVGKVRLEPAEGLVGRVAARAEALNVENAPEHPSFKYFPETGEERYRAFLGVPIIHQRSVKGVLVVQQQASRRFSDEDESLLFTLAAQLAGAIAHAEVSGDIDAFQGDASSTATRSLAGIAGAPGVGIGTVRVIYPHADLDAVPDRAVDDVEAECAAFEAAVARLRGEIGALNERLGETLPADERALFDAYLMILSGDSLVLDTLGAIRAGNWAPGALRATVQAHARVFDAMEDAYLRERAGDLRDLGRRLLMQLQDSGPSEEAPLPPGTVLAGDLTASDIASAPPGHLVGIVSSSGSGASHVAILAQALGVPAVMGVQELPRGRIDGEEAIVDGYQGRVYLRPTPGVRNEFQRLAGEERELSQGLHELRSLPAETVDGHTVPLLANTGLASDLLSALQSGAEGIGLYRTEVPFLVRERFPSEEEQTDLYRRVLRSFAPRPVILRSLDIGGDKSLSYFPIVEENPFLGWRGIRVTLDHPEILLTQLRAMLRASVGLNNLQVLLPMITSVSEFDEALVHLDRVHAELIENGMPVKRPPVGAMIEVPAALLHIDRFARRADFFSIGSNDLTQYLLAVDRNNRQVSGLYDALHPAVLAALRQGVDAAHLAGRPIGICGEMAGQPAAAVLLLGMGIDSLSMNAASLPRIKWVIRSFAQAQAREILDRALAMDSPEDVRRFVNSALERAGVGGLVRAGK